MSTWPNLTYDYRGAHVLVTGGSNGIGAGIAASFHAAGAHVTITGTRASAADYDDDLSAYRYLQLQLTDNAQIEAVAAAIPQVDILINNAGCNFMNDNEYEPEVFEKSIRVNLLSTYRITHALQEKLAQSKLPGGASVIGIASMTSYFGVELVPGYGAAKGALVQMTKTLAVAWAKHNIRVNAVAAGMIASKMTEFHLSIPEFSAHMLARTPQNRIGTAHDVAGAVLFLCSSAASYVTGQTLPVDGGYSIMG